MRQLIEKAFQFQYMSGLSESTLNANIAIPSSQSLNSLVAQLIQLNNLPCYVEDNLKKSLDSFIQEQTKLLFDSDGQSALDRVRNGQVSVDQLVDQWTKAFNQQDPWKFHGCSQEVKDFAKPEEVTNEQVFSEVYHTLIHSPALETLLNLEHAYAMAIDEITQDRDKDVEIVEEKQRKEMESTLQNAGTLYSDEQINQLAQRHFENTQVVNSKWASELTNRREMQKREYREWVMKVHEDTQTSVGTPTSYAQRVRAMTNSMLPEAAVEERIGGARVRLEESFTIHLGAQMKTTHNLRLICADVLDLCRHKPHTVGGVIIPEPQRLQTAMSLYSNNLCGLILLVDNRLNSYTGTKRDFGRVCEQATDFHFSDLEQQFTQIESKMGVANEWKLMRNMPDPDSLSVKSSGSSNSDTTQQEKTARLQTGDVYISKHSNLCEVQVVFHLVTDDSIRSSDITSRHPVILALRNLLKVCFRYDILTLTIPLLLSHEMVEEMTVAWCLKRVELIFKCVKGFMMEIATWGGQESRTIQFLVPPGMSEEMFANISHMLPTIFRLSNPLVVKSA